MSALGVDIGTTNASFTPTPAVDGSLAFTGPMVFTPRVGRASLTAQVDGTVDLNTGAFRASSTTVSGTGALSAVSGYVTLRGNEDLVSGAFTETINGRLCAPTSSRSAR